MGQCSSFHEIQDAEEVQLPNAKTFASIVREKYNDRIVQGEMRLYVHRIANDKVSRDDDPDYVAKLATALRETDPEPSDVEMLKLAVTIGGEKELVVWINSGHSVPRDMLSLVCRFSSFDLFHMVWRLFESDRLDKDIHDHPILSAIENERNPERRRIVSFLIEAGECVTPEKNVNGVFVYSCLRGDVDIVRMLLEKPEINPAPNMIHDDHYHDFFSDFPLRAIASRKGSEYLEIAHMLLKHKTANPRSASCQAYRRATESRNLEMQLLLLEDGRGIFGGEDVRQQSIARVKAQIAERDLLAAETKTDDKHKQAAPH